MTPHARTWRDQIKPTPRPADGRTLLTGRAYIPAHAHAGEQGLRDFAARLREYAKADRGA